MENVKYYLNTNYDDLMVRKQSTRKSAKRNVHLLDGRCFTAAILYITSNRHDTAFKMIVISIIL